MPKVTELCIGEVVARLHKMSELPLEECLGEIGDCARAEELDVRFFGVIAMSDRMLQEFGTALELASAEETAGLAACLLVLLDDVVKSYLRFTDTVMAESDSLVSKARHFPHLSLLHSLRPWLGHVLPPGENDSERDQPER